MSLDQRIHTLIQALAEYDEYISFIYDDITCQYCGGPLVSTTGKSLFQHEENCLVMYARALLKELEEKGK